MYNNKKEDVDDSSLSALRYFSRRCQISNDIFNIYTYNVVLIIHFKIDIIRESK